jgi:DNA-binding NtrC family response regulator
MSTILIVEDEHALGGALMVAIQRLGHRPLRAASGASAMDRLGHERVDAVVLDIGLPDMSGLAVLEQLRASGSKVPVLVITAHATLDHAIASQKLGVADYLLKPLDLARFEEAVSALVAEGTWVAEPTDSGAMTLIGAAPGMHEVFLAVARACAGDMPVFVSGPCGSGKSLAARVIHAHSARSSSALRVVDCHTVRSAQELRAVWADGVGTVVLDELPALLGEAQAALAGILADGTNDMPRWIATSREDPHQAVMADRLREDLYYAFSTLVVQMPSLADRTGDIPALSRFFFAMHETSPAQVEITAQALGALETYEWPGNVRELRHVLEHARAMSRGGAVYPGHLPSHVSAALRVEGGKRLSGELDAVLDRWLESQLEVTPAEEWRYDDLLDRIESATLLKLLQKFDHRPTRLAQALRMNRATLRQKLRRLGIRGEE